MSISVLLVDDEKLERVLIRQGFDWEKHGFQIIGEAECGEDALEFIHYRKPDVVVTDISMPRMDGLELSEEIRKIHKNCRIVIVTGYREFDYARRAISVGVEDFLLKPVNMKNMEEVAGKIKKRIEQERSQNKEVEELKKSIQEDRGIVRESFLQRLVSGRMSEEEAAKKLAVYNYEKLVEGCVCINVHIRGEKNEGMTEQIRQLTEQLPQKDRILCFLHYMQNLILFFMTEENSAVSMRQAEELAQKVHTAVSEQGNAAVAGISAWHRGLHGITRAYEEAEKAVGASVYLGRDRVITYAQYDEIMRQQPEREEIEWEDLVFCLENGMKDKMDAYVTEYMGRIWGFKAKSAEMLRLMTMNFLTKAGASLNKYGMSLIQLTDEEGLYNEICEIGTAEDMERILRQQLKTILEYHRSKKVKKGNRVVEEAKLYIQKSLYDPNLSLKTIAAGVYSNESYLSRIFKKEMEVSLIEYITQRRIEESIRLLDTTDLKVYEIAEKIGFRDSHYFSICFKKYTGKTVKEYKAT